MAEIQQRGQAVSFHLLTDLSYDTLKKKISLPIIWEFQHVWTCSKKDSHYLITATQYLLLNNFARCCPTMAKGKNSQN